MILSYLREKFPLDNFRIARYNGSGRNLIFLISNAKDNEVMFFAKKSNVSPREAIFYKEIQHIEAPFLPKLVHSDYKNNITIHKYYDNCKGLDKYQKDFFAVLDCLKNISISISSVHFMSKKKITNYQYSLVNLIDLDPVGLDIYLQSSNASIEFIKVIQKQGLYKSVKKRLEESAFTIGYIHGDIKLDNIIFDQPNKLSLLIDWENSGIGDIEYDIASLIGSALILWSDRAFERTKTEAVEFLALRKFVSDLLLLSNYKNKLSLEGIKLYTLFWIITRTWAEVSNSSFLTPIHLNRLVVSENLYNNPEILFDGQ